MSVRTPCLACALLLLGLPALAAANNDSAPDNPLSRVEAETRAIENDPAHSASMMRAESARQSAIAAGELPNPMLSLGLLNLPADDFDFDREAMTQLRLGLRQSFPRGDTLDLRSRGASLKANDAEQAAALRQKEVRRSVATAWLRAVLAERQMDILDSNRELFVQLQQITTSLYSVGRKNQQDVLRADLELARLDQRLAAAREMREVSRARLGRWIGPENSQRPLALMGALPAELPEVSLRADLPNHPAVKRAVVNVSQARNDTDLARQAYEPQWGVELAYGYRDDAPGIQRSDFISAMVTLDLPLFSERSSDANLASARARHGAAEDALVDRQQQLHGALDAALAQWDQRGAQLDLYLNRLLPTARSQREAALSAYQSDASDFGALVQAQTSLLNLELQRVQMDVSQRLSLVELRYLADDDLLPQLDTGESR